MAANVATAPTPLRAAASIVALRSESGKAKQVSALCFVTGAPGGTKQAPKRGVATWTVPPHLALLESSEASQFGNFAVR